MGNAYYTQSGFGLGYDGWAVFSPDDGQGTLYAPQYANCSQTTSDNRSNLQVADNSQLPHVGVLGARTGSLHIDGPIGIDRGWAGLINTVCGKRNETAPNSNNLTPWIATFKPGSVFTAFSQAAMWPSRIVIDSGWAVQGASSTATYSIDWVVCDPDNQYAVTNLTPPSISGTEGLNASSFLQMELKDSTGETPTTYDGFYRFVFTYDNGLVLQPANNAQLPGHRLAAGATAGQPSGTLQVFQLAGAGEVIPMSTGKHPFAITIPDPAGTHTMTLAVSTAYNASSQRTNSTSHVLNSVTYDLFSSSADTDGWLIKATYA